MKPANKQLAALFTVDSIQGFRQDVTLPAEYTPVSQQFFCINPLKERGRLTIENIAEYRNILVEMDTGSIEEQWKKVEEAKLPWTTCVYSGGKSLHFIVSVIGGLKSLEFYTDIASVLVEGLGADMSSVNPNRLSRLAGSVREDTGLEQELVEVRRAITLNDMLLYFRTCPPKYAKLFEAIQNRRTRERFDRMLNEQLAANSTGRDKLPRIYQDMVDTGAVHPEAGGSRHKSLVKFAVWLRDNWHDPNEVPALVTKAFEALGTGRYKDLDGVLSWLNKGS